MFKGSRRRWRNVKRNSTGEMAVITSYSIHYTKLYDAITPWFQKRNGIPAAAEGGHTAALGLALRAVGQGLRVSMVQFIKGSWKYGELKAPEFLPGFEIQPMGRGFVGLGGEAPHPEDVSLAAETFRVAREKVLSGDYDMVILDEVNYAVHYGRNNFV